MVTAASTADLAIILVDARKGVLTQTRRHSIIAHLMGIPHLVVAINKMDLVDYSQDVFIRIMADYLEFAKKRDIDDVHFIPISALEGDMVATRGEKLDWYSGPTLIEILEAAPLAHSEHAEPLRFPVQYVCRPQASADPELHDYRGFMGQVESGAVKAGDPVVALPSAQETRVRAVHLGGRDVGEAIAGQSVTLLLADEIDISRGDMLVAKNAVPAAQKQLQAILCWLAETPLDTSRNYLIRHTTREVKAKLARITHRLDVNTLERLPAERLAMNDIARVEFRLAQPVFTDPYAQNRNTGAFIVIDPSNNNTVGAGMVVA
jgi:sulfate adenylyltransferase subunit 1